MITNLRLTQSDGKPLRVSDYRQKQNLVILFIDDAGSGLLSRLVSTLSERYAEFKAEEAEILVVVGQRDCLQPWLQVELPFPVVTFIDSDMNGKAAAILSSQTGAAVYVLDRYGEVYASYHPDDTTGVPTADDLLEWLRFIELQCPE